MTQAAATPWGKAKLVDEIRLQQRAGDRRFASLVQLLVSEEGEALVRFAYTTGGVARRGPVTLRARDLVRLKAALADHPELATALSCNGGVMPKRPQRPAEHQPHPRASRG